MKSNWIRPFHRWVAVAFTLGVVANFIALGSGEPPSWVYGLALIPLALLQLTGMVLFVQPYLARRRQPAAASQRIGS